MSYDIANQAKCLISTVIWSLDVWGCYKYYCDNPENQSIESNL